MWVRVVQKDLPGNDDNVNVDVEVDVDVDVVVDAGDEDDVGEGCPAGSA